MTLAANAILDGFVQQVGWAAVGPLLTLLAGQIVEFRDGLKGRPDAMRPAAHTLRGAAGALGFTALAEIAAEIERACKAGAPDVALLDRARAIAASAGHDVSCLLSEAA